MSGPLRLWKLFRHHIDHCVAALGQSVESWCCILREVAADCRSYFVAGRSPYVLTAGMLIAGYVVFHSDQVGPVAEGKHFADDLPAETRLEGMRFDTHLYS
jgi:hypothetical protein